MHWRWGCQVPIDSQPRINHPLADRLSKEQKLQILGQLTKRVKSRRPNEPKTKRPIYLPRLSLPKCINAEFKSIF